MKRLLVATGVVAAVLDAAATHVFFRDGHGLLLYIVAGTAGACAAPFLLVRTAGNRTLLGGGSIGLFLVAAILVWHDAAVVAGWVMVFWLAVVVALLASFYSYSRHTPTPMI